MFKSGKLLIPIILLMLWSCKTGNKYNYSIKDFRKALQPYLFKIVDNGEVESFDSSLKYMATDNELIHLSQSEHPILRASAFSEMLDRSTFNHFDILMDHLDDTAIVPINAGEFGIWFRKISDYILFEAKWKSIEDKKMTIDKVITSHNYLESAYTILSSLEAQEKYYPFIKEMAGRNIEYNRGYGGLKFEDIEYALYGLAKFGKREDVKIIKDQLMSNLWQISETSFRLMREYPDTAYLDIFEKYYRQHFYSNICAEGGSSKAADFINSIATYKNSRSEKTLDSIVNHKKFGNCQAGIAYIEQELIYAIWKNPCDAYAKLRTQLARKIEEYEKSRIELSPLDPIDMPADTAAEKISW